MKYDNPKAGEEKVTSSTTTQSKPTSTSSTETSQDEFYRTQTTTINAYTDTETTVDDIRIPVTEDVLVTLDVYIQKVTLPQIAVDGGQDITTLFGKFPVPGNIVIPDTNTFTMEVVNVKAPVIENVFYPWMRETTLPWWSYDA